MFSAALPPEPPSPQDPLLAEIAGYLAVEGLGRSGDFMVWTRGRFEERLRLQASLPAAVLREGKLLYAG